MMQAPCGMLFLRVIQAYRTLAFLSTGYRNMGEPTAGEPVIVSTCKILTASRGKLKDRGSFVMKNSAVPPGKLSDEGDTPCCLKARGEKDKLLQNVTALCCGFKAACQHCNASSKPGSRSASCFTRLNIQTKTGKFKMKFKGENPECSKTVGPCFGSKLKHESISHIRLDF